MTQEIIKTEAPKVVFSTDEQRWKAVLQRDRSADGQFVFSVATTGVYCRPSCAARRARRENVRFHQTVAEAEAAGFRACLRCRPNERPFAERQAEVIAEACRMMEVVETPPSLNALAHTAGMSRFHFARVFKNVTGVTPRAYYDECRLRRTQRELTRSRTITDAIYDSGFQSNGRFYAQSERMLGMTPTAFRGGGDRVAIRFAVGESSLGSVLVAATEKGICSILLGDDPEVLVHDLENRFPRAELIAGDQNFERLVGRVIELVEHPGVCHDLPLDVQGTAFQQRVWRALRDIPTGGTVNYEGLAERIGMPKGARAVAQACAANPLAIAIPCHRVVRKDGDVSGYRWGVERKRLLLEREALRATR